MELLKKGYKYLELFLYKKHLKIDISMVYFSLVSFLCIVFFENSFFVKLFSLVMFLLTCVWLFIETNIYSNVNELNYYKTQFIYFVLLVSFIILPYDYFIICLIFIVPYFIYFTTLSEYYLENDSLHWPYVFHLAYGGVLFLLSFLLKEFLMSKNVLPKIDNRTLAIFKPFTLAFIVNEIATELVDLRTIIKCKVYLDLLKGSYDTLTEIPGRGGLNSLFDKEKINVVAMLDLDKFKEVNDTFGHDAGDIVLKFFASKIECLVSRNTEDLFCCRWGGEEFLVVGTNYEDVKDICVELSSIMRTSKIWLSNKDYVIKTFSCGIAKRESEEESFNSLVTRADEQSYLSKQKGRNMIHVDGEVIC